MLVKSLAILATLANIGAGFERDENYYNNENETIVEIFARTMDLSDYKVPAVDHLGGLYDADDLVCGDNFFRLRFRLYWDHRSEAFPTPAAFQLWRARRVDRVSKVLRRVHQSTEQLWIVGTEKQVNELFIAK